jgi:hypothetical protein
VTELLAARDEGLSAALRAIAGVPSAEERKRAVGLLGETLFRAA